MSLFLARPCPRPMQLLRSLRSFHPVTWRPKTTLPPSSRSLFGHAQGVGFPHRAGAGARGRPFSSSAEDWASPEQSHTALWDPDDPVAIQSYRLFSKIMQANGKQTNLRRLRDENAQGYYHAILEMEGATVWHARRKKWRAASADAVKMGWRSICRDMQRAGHKYRRVAATEPQARAAHMAQRRRKNVAQALHLVEGGQCSGAVPTASLLEGKEAPISRRDVLDRKRALGI